MTSGERAVAIGLGASTMVALLLVPSGLRAAGDEAGARVLFLEARRLAAEGDFAAACPKFEDSYRLDPGIGTSFNLADCYEHRGLVASAWARFLDVAAATKALGQSERERVALARAALLEPKLARLTIEVGATALGLSVVRDGIAIGAASWGVAVPIDPGSHIVEASAPGRIPWKTTVDVREGPSAVTVAIPELAVVPAAPIVELVVPAPRSANPRPAAEVSAAPQGPQRRWSRPVVALGAIGGAALAVGAAFGIKFEMDNGEAEAICPASTNCTTVEAANHAALVRSAGVDLKLEVVGLAAGGAALLTAGYLWWREARHDRGRPTSRLALAAMPFGPVGLAVGGNW
jgi:hypothetical protein